VDIIMILLIVIFYLGANLTLNLISWSKSQILEFVIDNSLKTGESFEFNFESFTNNDVFIYVEISGLWLNNKDTYQGYSLG
jgi:hypothetical protein